MLLGYGESPVRLAPPLARGLHFLVYSLLGLVVGSSPRAGSSSSQGGSGAAEVEEGSVGPMMAETADASLRSDEPQDRGRDRRPRGGLQ